MNKLTKNIKLLEKVRYINKRYATDIIDGIGQLEKKYSNYKTEHKEWVNENDVMLITYGDSIIRDGETPLQTLKKFFDENGQNALNAIHLLPFYPFTSDDGFSVVDYLKVDKKLGDWKDIKSISENYDLMFDAVINHISSESEWFKGYLNGEQKYLDYFIEADPKLDYSTVVRPRALPLLSKYETSRGERSIWTTFSRDQIDLNFRSKNLILEIIEILIKYAINGARYIRLDAIGFLWKELNSTCLHLDETHEIIKIIRIVLDEIVPGTILITETNVPHIENISYFGNGYDEAQMVYQFPLPPLTLHTFIEGNSTKILGWIDSLKSTTDTTTYFNFLASHDGIGLRPVQGILSQFEKNKIVDTVRSRGGKVNYRTLSDGSKEPYELNITFVDALTDLEDSDEMRAKIFLASQGILLSVAGVPGIYIHSLLGSRNYDKGVAESGINRRINREKLNLDLLKNELKDNSLRQRIFYPYLDLINIRKTSSAFSPTSVQISLFIHSKLFTIIRHDVDKDEKILVVINISNEIVEALLPFTGYDLISTKEVDMNINVKPYQILWIRK
ncbi:MAG: sugar phosphorylase [Spirochaetaceae bacterium]